MEQTNRKEAALYQTDPSPNNMKIRHRITLLFLSVCLAFVFMSCGPKTVEGAVSIADKTVQELDKKGFNGYDYSATYIDTYKVYGITMKTWACRSSDDFDKKFIFDSTVSRVTIPHLTDEPSDYAKRVYESFEDFDDVRVIVIILYGDNMIKAAVVDGKEVYYSNVSDDPVQFSGDADFIFLCEHY